MGACFSRKTNAAVLPPETQKSDDNSGRQQPPNTRNDQQAFKKEIFVIKHRVSHEIDRHSDRESDKNPSATASSASGAGARPGTSGCTKEEMEAIITQCDRLSRSNSAGAQNPIRRRRYSRSKRSFDLGLSMNVNADNDDDYEVDDEDDALNHHRRHRHRQPEVRVSSSRRSSSRERRISISPSRQSSTKDRRISISPSRRSQSPFGSLNRNPPVAAGGGSSSRPAKMVSVPATDKSNNAGVVQQVSAGAVKRIHVKRNVSPARMRLQDSNTREADHRRKSLVEIDNNAARTSAQVRDTKRTRRLSRDLDMKPESVIEPGSGPSPSAPSYASLLLEDIHNFHKKNTNAVTTPPSFALPECVSKACLIMEAVADMNSSTSSLCSDDRWRNTTSIKKDSSEIVINGLT